MLAGWDHPNAQVNGLGRLVACSVVIPSSFFCSRKGMTRRDGAAVIRKRGAGLQVQVYAGRDPLTGRKRYVSEQVPGQGKAALRQAKQVEARLLAEVGAGRHKGTRSRTMAELLERWMQWRPTVRPIAPTTVASYRAALDRYILPALGKLLVRQLDAATLDAFYARLRTAGGKDGHPLKASTVHEVHAVLSGALKQAVVWGWTGPGVRDEAVAPQHEHSRLIVNDGCCCHRGHANHVVLEALAVRQLHVHEPKAYPLAGVDRPLTVDLPLHRPLPLAIDGPPVCPTRAVRDRPAPASLAGGLLT
jgi:Phage integrase, N-terminal SAM-like domain